MRRELWASSLIFFSFLEQIFLNSQRLQKHHSIPIHLFIKVSCSGLCSLIIIICFFIENISSVVSVASWCPFLYIELLLWCPKAWKWSNCWSITLSTYPNSHYYLIWFPLPPCLLCLMVFDASPMESGLSLLFFWYHTHNSNILDWCWEL